MEDVENLREVDEEHEGDKDEKRNNNDLSVGAYADEGSELNLCDKGKFLLYILTKSCQNTQQRPTFVRSILRKSCLKSRHSKNIYFYCVHGQNLF